MWANLARQQLLTQSEILPSPGYTTTPIEGSSQNDTVSEEGAATTQPTIVYRGGFLCQSITSYKDSSFTPYDIAGNYLKMDVNPSRGCENKHQRRQKLGHTCSYCGKVYSRKYGLKIHIR